MPNWSVDSDTLRQGARPAPLEIVHRAAPCHNVPVTFTLERMSSPESCIERTWYAVAPNGAGEGPVTFSVGLPKQEPGGGWSVLVIVGGLEPGPLKIYGEDGWQAVRLGMRFIKARVSDFSDRGWQFFWRKDEDSASAEDLASD